MQDLSCLSPQTRAILEALLGSPLETTEVKARERVHLRKFEAGAEAVRAGAVDHAEYQVFDAEEGLIYHERGGRVEVDRRSARTEEGDTPCH